MDLFTLGAAKALAGGGSGSGDTVPDHLIHHMIFSYNDDTDKYEWENNAIPEEYSSYPFPIQIYHDKTASMWLLPCRTDTDEYAEYTYIDTTTGTLYYKVFHFEPESDGGITLSVDKSYTLTETTG